MPRFAILRHDHPFLHWDFLLERGDVAHCWRLSSSPVAGAVIAAERLADHRLLYLDYEGPISGDRGVVVRVDGGTFADAEVDATDSLGMVICSIRFEGNPALAVATLIELANGRAVWTFR